MLDNVFHISVITKQANAGVYLVLFFSHKIKKHYLLFPSLQVASAGEEDCGQSEVTKPASLLPNVYHYKGT